eukprot:m.891456 g.891456  ORF g.891456 m.891456 type:complete len:67 (+) comp59965_c0_seq3:3743-3943(+)
MPVRLLASTQQTGASPLLSRQFCRVLLHLVSCCDFSASSATSLFETSWTVSTKILSISGSCEGSIP